mmetsp:Transcript_14372/g.34038  ORF Transcript_14372/g.34038 Transcript_14372/m.34038 type:complete len:554 (-) Transcript_14372:4471-6132(-)
MEGLEALEARRESALALHFKRRIARSAFFARSRLSISQAIAALRRFRSTVSSKTNGLPRVACSAEQAAICALRHSEMAAVATSYVARTTPSFASARGSTLSLSAASRCDLREAMAGALVRRIRASCEGSNTSSSEVAPGLVAVQMLQENFFIALADAAVIPWHLRWYQSPQKSQQTQAPFPWSSSMQMHVSPFGSFIDLGSHLERLPRPDFARSMALGGRFSSARARSAETETPSMDSMSSTLALLLSRLFRHCTSPASQSSAAASRSFSSWSRGLETEESIPRSTTSSSSLRVSRRPSRSAFAISALARSSQRLISLTADSTFAMAPAGGLTRNRFTSSSAAASCEPVNLPSRRPLQREADILSPHLVAESIAPVKVERMPSSTGRPWASLTHCLAWFSSAPWPASFMATATRVFHSDASTTRRRESSSGRDTPRSSAAFRCCTAASAEPLPPAARSDAAFELHWLMHSLTFFSSPTRSMVIGSFSASSRRSSIAEAAGLSPSLFRSRIACALPDHSLHPEMSAWHRAADSSLTLRLAAASMVSSTSESLRV